MVTIICKTCLHPFHVVPNRTLTAKYCSDACYQAAHPACTILCTTCGKVFIVPYVRRAKAKYCSRVCRNFRHMYPCIVCGSEVERTRSAMKTRRYVYCSVDCERQYHRDHLSGTNHPRFLQSALLPDFTQAQKEMIIGTLLGDGCLLRNSAGNAHLQLAQSVKQRAYLDYKHAFLAPFSRPINTHKRLDTRSNCVYETHRFHTVCHPWLTYVREQLYPENKKQLVPFVDSWLSPRALAFWYMDDGTCIRGSTFSICTVSFAEEDVARVTKLVCTMGLDAWVWKGRIMISARSKYKLRELIGPYVPESMQYKLGFAGRQSRLL